MDYLFEQYYFKRGNVEQGRHILNVLINFGQAKKKVIWFYSERYGHAEFNLMQLLKYLFDK